MRKIIIAAMLAAFGKAVVIPAAAIVGTIGAYAAQKSAGKTAKKKKKAPKKKKAASTM